MNYLKVYCNLIRKAEKRGYSKKKAKEQGLYVEGHHTFPVSIFGKNKRIVYLTAREHYITHSLLEKVCIKRYGLNHWKTKKMTNAHIIMGGRGKYKNSYIYENARKRYSQNRCGIPMKQSSKIKLRNQRLGKRHPPELVEQITNKIRGQKRSKEQKDRMSKAQKGISKKTLKIKNEEFRNKFIEAVNTSLTKKEIIIKLGMNPKSGSSYGLIDKWVKILNLDVSHLIGSFIHKGRKNNEDTKRKWSITRRGIKKSVDHKTKIKLSNCKFIYTFISPKDVVTETILYSDFCLKNNLNPCKVREVARGVRPHHKGWKITRRSISNDDK